MSKKFIVGMFVVLGFLNLSLPSHAEITQYIIKTDTAEFTNMYWNWNGNGNDMKLLNGTYWEGSLSVEPISSGFIITYGFSNDEGAVFNSGPLTFSSFDSGNSGYFEFDGMRYGHEVDVHVHSTDWGHADTFVWTEGPVIVPEPISSTLFIVGGATLGFRRFRKKLKTI